MTKTYDLKNYFEKNTSVSSPKSRQTIINFIKNYKGKYDKFMSSHGLIDCPTFGDEYQRRLNDSVGFNQADYNIMSKASKNIVHTRHVTNKPANLILYFAYKEEKKEYRDEFLYFCAYVMYTGLFRIFFQYSTKGEVVEYMFNNHLNNNSYMYKFKRVDAALRETVDVTINTYRNTLLKDDTDDNIVKFINQLYNRVKSMIKKIANKYYDIYNDTSETMVYKEKATRSEDTLITLNTNSTTVQRIMDTFKEQELKNNLHHKMYSVADEKLLFIGNMRVVYEKYLTNIFSISNVAFNVFFTKRKADASIIKKHFCNDCYTGTIKSIQLSEEIEIIRKASGVKTNDAKAFKTAVVRYIGLRIREICGEVV